MRTFMTLMTLGAAGTGYVYLQQSSSIGEPTISRRFDWTRSINTDPAVAHVPVDELRGRIRERTRSVLDEFSNQQRGHSDAPVDDAFQRLKQLAKSTVTVATVSQDPSDPGLDSQSLSQVPRPDLDELQRTAFDPSLVETNPINLTTNQVKSTVDSRTIEPLAKRPESKDVSNVESATNTTRSKSEPIVEGATADVTRLVAQNKPSHPSAKPTTKRDARPMAAEWRVVGKTTEGRPMHSMHLGQQGTRTLVIAGLNGDDRTAVYWLERLADELRKRPDVFENNEIVLFRAGNPDGLVKNQRSNARGVPLNRNFPSRRFRPTSDMPQFAVPASEIETRVILDTLYSFRPRRIIHLTSTTGPALVLHNRLAKDIAGELERGTKLTVQPFDAEQFPGSIEDFSDGTLDAAVLSLRLDIGNDWQSSWSALRSNVLSAVVGRPFEAAKGAVAASEPDPDRTPIPTTPVEPVSRRPRRSGYEELPPPPF